MGHPVHRLGWAALALTIAGGATAQPMPVERKADLACEKKIVDKLGAAAEAQLLDGTRQHDKSQFTACFSVRTTRGSHRMVMGACNYSPAGEPVGEVVVLDSSAASDLCSRRMSGR